MPAATATLDLVLDTNVVLDWLAFRNPIGAALEQALSSGRWRWLCTGAMRDELAHVIGRESLARWSIDALAVLTVFDALALPMATPAPRCAAASPRCADPDDQMFIDLAIACSAHALLTRDRALLRLASRARSLGLSIATPEAWLRWPGGPG
jgi:predicted nucleic acid-binding protein